MSKKKAEKVRGVERKGKEIEEERETERMVLDAIVIISQHLPHLWMTRRKTHTTQS